MDRTCPLPKPLSPNETVGVLIEEYRSLYSLVLFRMAAIDRRVPVTAAAAFALLAGVSTVPRPGQLPILLGVPLMLVWLLRTTINHARSCEDALRRIEEIEESVNAVAGEELLAFQNRHPSRGSAVGGRTGEESVSTVYTICLAVLAGCMDAARGLLEAEFSGLWGYGLYELGSVLLLGRLAYGYSRYRYTKSQSLEGVTVEIS